MLTHHSGLLDKSSVQFTENELLVTKATVKNCVAYSILSVAETRDRALNIFLGKWI